MTIQIMPSNPFNPDRLYKLFILGCLIVLALIISDMFHSCKKEQIEINPIKETIKEDLKRKDSVKEVIVYRDSIRTKYITKWRTIRHDSLIPCEEKLARIDTILYVDSLLISDLKSEILLDDTIIKNYQTVVSLDSINIIGLNKQLSRQKKKTKIALFFAGLLGVVAVIH